MKTLHRYLVREILAALVMTVAVFTFVLLLGNVLKEVLGLLISGQVRVTTVLLAIGLLVPYVLVFALPMGLLTATLLVFGRFSADNELTAARANGISLLNLVTPVLLLSLFFSCVSAAINTYVGPRCRVIYKHMLLKAGLERVASVLPEKVFIKDISNLIIYVGEVDGRTLEDVVIYRLNDAGRVESYMRASSGTLNPPQGNIISGQLKDLWQTRMVEGSEVPETIHLPAFDFVHTNTAAQSEVQVQISDKSFWELREELRDLERRVAEPPAPRARSLSQLTLPLLMELHRQTSFSFACVAFTMVGIPLGIRAHRRETTFGIFVALLLVALYYSFFVLADSLDHDPRNFAYLWLWVPNFLFQGVGAFLLWRSNRSAW